MDQQTQLKVVQCQISLLFLGLAAHLRELLTSP